MSEELKVDVLLVLYANPSGVWLTDLPRAFLGYHGRHLDLSSCDCSLRRLAAEMAGMVERRLVGGEEKLFAGGLVAPAPGPASPSPLPAWAQLTPPSTRALATGPEAYALRAPRALETGPEAYALQAHRALATGPEDYALRAPRALVTGPEAYALRAPQALATGPEAYAPWPASLQALGLAVPFQPGIWPAHLHGRGQVAGCTLGPVRALARARELSLPPRAGSPTEGAARGAGRAREQAPGPRAATPAIGGGRPLTYSQAVQVSCEGRPGVGAVVTGERQAAGAAAAAGRPELNTKEWPSPAANRKPAFAPGAGGQNGTLENGGDALEPPWTTRPTAAKAANTRRVQAARDGGVFAEWLLDLLRTKGYRDGLRVNKLAKLSLVQRRQELAEMLHDTGYDSLPAFLTSLPYAEVDTTRGAPNNFLIRLRPGYEGETQETPDAESPTAACPAGTNASSVPGERTSSRSAPGIQARKESDASSRAVLGLRRTVDPTPAASPSGPSLSPLMPQEAETAQQVQEKVVRLVWEHPEGLSVFQLRRAYARAYYRPLNPLGYTTLKELLQRMPDGVCLRGLGVQARVYPSSAVEASPGSLHPSTWMDTGPHSIGLSLDSAKTEASESRGTGSPEAGIRADARSPATEPGPGSSPSFLPLRPHLLDPGLPLPSPRLEPALRLGGCPALPGPAYFQTRPRWAHTVRRAPPTQCLRPSAPTPWGLLARPAASPGLQGGLVARPAYAAPWGLYQRRPPAGYLLPYPEEEQKPCALL